MRQTTFNLAIKLLFSLGALSLNACSSGSNEVPGVSVPENNLSIVQGYLANGNTELATAQANLDAAKEALAKAEVSTTEAEKTAALNEAARLITLANTSLTNADKQLNTNTNAYLSSASGASSTITNDINTAREELAKAQTELQTLTTQLNDTNALIAAQTQAEAAAVKAQAEAEAAVLAAAQAASEAEAAKKAAEEEAANAQALADAQKAAEQAAAAKKAAADAEAAAKTAEEAVAAAQAAADAEAAAKAAAEALAAAQAAEAALKAAQAAEAATKAAEEAATLATAAAQAKFEARTTNYSVNQADSVVHTYASEEMRDALLKQIKNKGNYYGANAVATNYDYYNCANNAQTRCGSSNSLATYRYDNTSGQFVDETGTKEGTVVINVANAYSGYAVIREDRDKTGVTNSFISLVDSQHQTTDKAAVVNATYKGYASHSQTAAGGAINHTSQFEMTVNNGNVSGLVYQTQSNQNRTRTIAVFEDTAVQVNNGNVGFEGTAKMNLAGDATWNSGLTPSTNISSNAVTGSYQGSFAGSGAEEVTGTFESYKDNTLYMQGAFAGSK